MKKVTNIELDFLDEKINVENIIENKNNLFITNFLDIILKKRQYLKNDECSRMAYKKLLLNNINSINKCLNCNDRILCWGDVQSGKTDNIICLSMFLLDNNFDIVIIFGGTSNLLYNQTDNRINEIFGINDSLLYLNKNDIGKVEIEEALNLEKKIVINALKSFQNAKS